MRGLFHLEDLVVSGRPELTFLLYPPPEPVQQVITSFFFSQGGKYLQAVIQYGKIVSWLEMEYGLSEKESKASESFLLAAFLNLAMCYLKLREYTKAVECCDKVKVCACGLDCRCSTSFSPSSYLVVFYFFLAQGWRACHFASLYSFVYLGLFVSREIQKDCDYSQTFFFLGFISFRGRECAQARKRVGEGRGRERISSRLPTEQTVLLRAPSHDP